jgi:hypothetical protein
MFIDDQILKSGWQKAGPNEFRFEAWSIRRTAEGWKAKHRDGDRWTPASYEFPAQAITVAPVYWDTTRAAERERAHESFRWIWEAPAKAAAKPRAPKPGSAPPLNSLPLFGV